MRVREVIETPVYVYQPNAHIYLGPEGVQIVVIK